MPRPWGSFSWALGSGVEVDGDFWADRKGLAGEDEVAGDLVRLECVVAHHVDLADADLRPAGPADAALAGEGQVGPHLLRGVEYRLRALHRRRRRPPVESDRHLAGDAVDPPVGMPELRRRLVAVEQLEVHPLRRDAELV